jgi:hypothetical protein
MDNLIPNDCPPTYADIIRQCCHHHASKRPTDIVDLCISMNDLLNPDFTAPMNSPETIAALHQQSKVMYLLCF